MITRQREGRGIGSSWITQDHSKESTLDYPRGDYVVYRLIMIKALQGKRTGSLLPASFPASISAFNNIGSWELSRVSTAL